MDDESVGERIRRLRLERGLSLAKVVGGDFSRAFLNQVELGKSQPSMRILRVVARRLGTHVEYLLDGSTPTLDREVALERARISLARRDYRKTLAALEPALETKDWPLGTDARLCAAEAMLGMNRTGEAEGILAIEEPEIRRHGDRYRLRKLRALRNRKEFRMGHALDARELGEAYAKAADSMLRAGKSSAALEHYRSARVLLEAAPQLKDAAVRAQARTSTSVAAPP